MAGSPIAVLLGAASLAVLLVWSLRVPPLLRRLGLPMPVSWLLLLSFLLYASCLVPGALGLLAPVPVASSLILAALLLQRFLARAASGGTLPQAAPSPAASAGPRLPVFFLAVLGGAAGVIPLVRYAFRLLRGLFDPQLPLTVDVVTYHLPGLIEFLQKRTLWSMEGYFQSYSFGYDLIAGFPALFLPSHSGLYLADALSVALLLSSLRFLCGEIARLAEGRFPFPALPAWVFASGMWLWFFRPDKLHVGKNDVFLSACLLASFALLLRILALNGKDLSARRDRAPAILSALALALALAAKPSTLAYPPALCLALYAILRFRLGGRGASALLKPAAQSCKYLLLALLGGGFFYFRNLFMLGHIAKPELLPSAFAMTVLGNLGNPLFWRPSKGFILLFFAVLVLLLLALALWIWRKDQEVRAMLALLLVFCLAALASFVVHPFAVFQVTGAGPAVDNRYGMVLIVLMFLSLPLLTGLLGAGNGFRATEPVPAAQDPAGGEIRPSFLPAAVWMPAAAVLLAAASSAWYAAHPLRGLPGFESRRGLPATGAYRFIQGLPEPVRIFSAGLPPYGLYGDHWRNRVLYDLSSAALFHPPQERERMAEVLEVFDPDYIVVSVDAFLPPGKPFKPDARKWREGWEEVYADEAVSVFRMVKP